jgi:hypothetical protein
MAITAKRILLGRLKSSSLSFITENILRFLRLFVAIIFLTFLRLFVAIQNRINHPIQIIIRHRYPGPHQQPAPCTVCSVFFSRSDDSFYPAKPARHRSRPSAIGFASGECRAGSGEAGGSAG